MYTLTVVVWLLSLMIISIQYIRWLDRYNAYESASTLTTISKHFLMPILLSITLFGFYVGVSGMISMAILVDTKGLGWREVTEQIPLSWIFLTGVITLLISGLYNSFYYYMVFHKIRRKSFKIGGYFNWLIAVIGAIASIATLVAFWLEYL